MPEGLSFSNSVCRALQDAGWRVAVLEDGLEATRDDIIAQWWFGRRVVSTHLRCVFDASSKILDYRELAKEVVTGLPPPTLSFSRYKQSGLTLTIDRNDRSLAGRGELHYGQVAELLETLCKQNGWQARVRLFI